VPSSNQDSTAPIDLEEILITLLPKINDAVRWLHLRYKDRIRQDELDDLSQQIILLLIEDNCRRLRSFNGQSSFRTWLQEVVTNHICHYLKSRKQNESLDEVDQAFLAYSPLLDQAIVTAERRKLLLIALRKLTQEEQRLYQLWFLSELDAKEIADIFGTEVKIIYKRKQTLFLKLTRLLRNFQSY
jgi:RNA polymerase sigma factor (sigma-70 family)